MSYVLSPDTTLTAGLQSSNVTRSTNLSLSSMNMPLTIKLLQIVGRDISVGIATRYGLNGPGIESRWC
jgi:hypothetical protein